MNDPIGPRTQSGEPGIEGSDPAAVAAQPNDVWHAGNGFVADSWRPLDADESDNRPPLHPVEALEEAREADLAVLLQPGEDVDRLAPYLGRLALVAVAFPAYTDGRGYSMAARLRRLGYDGPLRAVGDVLLDQVPYMLRCGFTELAVTHEPTRQRLAADDLPDVDLHYQPVARPEEKAGGYSWRRRSV